jgi:hypothetical protein
VDCGVQTPKMKAMHSSEALVTIYKTTRRYNPEVYNIHFHSLENFTSYTKFIQMFHSVSVCYTHVLNLNKKHMGRHSQQGNMAR